MSSRSSKIMISFLLFLSNLLLITSVIGFYWSLGLPVMFDDWRTDLLPVCLISLGVLIVLTVSWRISSNELSRSKKLSKRIIRTKYGRTLGMILGWELVFVVYLLVNLCLVALKLYVSLSTFFAWQDSVFYAFVLSQLVSSICVAISTGLIGRYA